MKVWRVIGHILTYAKIFKLRTPCIYALVNKNIALHRDMGLKKIIKPIYGECK